MQVKTLQLQFKLNCLQFYNINSQLSTYIQFNYQNLDTASQVTI